MLASLALFISCEDKPAIEEDKFVRIYAELVSVPDSVSVDSTQFSLYRKKVFAEFNLTEEQYISTIEFYNKDPKRWEEFFKKVVKDIEATDDSSSNLP